MTETIDRPRVNYFNEAQQRWLIQRLGKITSSNCSLLFQGGKRPMTPEELAEEKAVKGRRTTVDTLFGDGAMTYLHGLIDEMTTGEPKEEMDFKQTEWGKANEMDGVFLTEEKMGFKIDYHGISNPEFIPYGDFAGGSPDGKVIGQKAIVEVKCHYDGGKHIKKLLIKTVDQFKDKFWEEYCQDQANCLFTESEGCYSISYDPRKKDPALRLKIIYIPVDQEWQDEFKMRLEAATNILADLHSELYNSLLIR